MNRTELNEICFLFLRNNYPNLKPIDMIGTTFEEVRIISTIQWAMGMDEMHTINGVISNLII